MRYSAFDSYLIVPDVRMEMWLIGFCDLYSAPSNMIACTYLGMYFGAWP